MKSHEKESDHASEEEDRGVAQEEVEAEAWDGHEDSNLR